MHHPTNLNFRLFLIESKVENEEIHYDTQGKKATVIWYFSTKMGECGGLQFPIELPP